MGIISALPSQPAEIFGKTMSISDDLMMSYYELLTDIPTAEIKAMHPRDAKKKLAGLMVTKFYGEKKAGAAESEFEEIFKAGGKPQDIELVKLNKKGMNIIDLLVETKLASSKSEARRLVQQGGVAVDEEIIKDEKFSVNLTYERLLKVGKRRFLRIKVT